MTGHLWPDHQEATAAETTEEPHNSYGLVFVADSCVYYPIAVWWFSIDLRRPPNGAVVGIAR